MIAKYSKAIAAALSGIFPVLLLIGVELPAWATDPELIAAIPAVLATLFVIFGPKNAE